MGITKGKPLEVPKEPHLNSLNEYKMISQWGYCTIPYSRCLKWTEWGLFGVLIDYTLSYLEGCIVEIGVGWSSIYVTAVAKKYNRQTFHCDIQHGVMANFASVDGYFKEDATLYVGNSDDFFKEIDFPPVAVALIDGGHKYEQAKKDFENLFPLMVDNGFIFIHDTYPPEEDWTTPNMCGDGYRLRQELEKRTDLDCFTFVYAQTVRAMGVGLTIIRKKPKDLPHFQR